MNYLFSKIKNQIIFYSFFVLLFLLTGCKQDYFHDYISQGRVITLSGPCSIVGSLPFTQVTITPKSGYPIYLSFKKYPMLKSTLYSECTGNRLKVTGKTQVLELTSGNNKYSFIQYVMVLDTYKLIQSN